MPWVIGIDEAGYGPNLGPLVMSAVACQLPPRLGNADLWTTLKSAVRRHASDEDGRIVVEDSKLVYSAAQGLAALEIGVLATLSALPGEGFTTLKQCLARLSPAASIDLEAELWYSGASALPLSADSAVCATAGERFVRACRRRGVLFAHIRSVIICPPRFNRLVNTTGSKGTALAHGLMELVECLIKATDGAEPTSFFIDKHGGRNTYAAMLQQALPDGFVMAQVEGLERSSYCVVGLGREVRLTFEPRADANHFCVALASMVSKYLREALMSEFNRFWQTHIPDLKPTAGYPGDAARFFEAIRPAVQRLGVAEELIWRQR